ncbi:hypothetical protein FZZ93_03445 [Halomonas eurihalina]|uniref:DUF3568 family protein n=1 Tax=Halomonas eurihalina TaxID=42566 RepID=A0A5D9DBT8_HALER|nr:hypothetical protein [Halomonas eurihalina]MDR5859216.1 hypothetical protein [Halomonas eurihalina]TZG40963.1 hypothetical protein FZZ93_03445 [Halomonas eurihalina]
MRRWLLGFVLTVTLGGCASMAPPAPAEPATGNVPGSVVEVLDESMALLMESGYVIRHADADLGRVEAILGRWPGYRVRLEVQPAERGSRVEMTALRGGYPLPPDLLEPWLMTLRSRLGSGL